MSSIDNGKLLKRANATLEKLLKKESSNRSHLSQSNFSALRSSLFSFIRKLNAKLVPKIQENDVFLRDIKALKNLSRLSADQIDRQVIISEKNLFSKYFREKRHYKLDLLEKYYSNYFSVNVPDSKATREEREHYKEQLESLASSLEGAHATLVSHILERVIISENEYLKGISRHFDDVLSEKFYEQLEKVELCNRLKLPAQNFLNKFSENQNRSNNYVQDKNLKSSYQTADLGNEKQREFLNIEKKNSQTDNGGERKNLNSQNKHKNLAKTKKDNKDNGYERLAEDILNNYNGHQSKDKQLTNSYGTESQSQKYLKTNHSEIDKQKSSLADNSVAKKSNQEQNRIPGNQSSKQQGTTGDNKNGLKEDNRSESNNADKEKEFSGKQSSNYENNPNGKNPLSTDGSNSSYTSDQLQQQNKFSQNAQNSEAQSSNSTEQSSNSSESENRSKSQRSEIDNNKNSKNDSNLMPAPKGDVLDQFSALGTAEEESSEDRQNVQLSNENNENYSSTGNFLLAREQDQMKSDDVIDLPNDIDLNENIFSEDSDIGDSPQDESCSSKDTSIDNPGAVDLDNIKSLADMLNEMGVDYENMLDSLDDIFWPNQFWNIPKPNFGFSGDSSTIPNESEEGPSLDSEQEESDPIDPGDEMISELLDSFFNNSSVTRAKKSSLGRNQGNLSDSGDDFVHYFGIIEHNKGIQKLIDRLGRCMGLDRSQEEKMMDANERRMAQKSKQNQDYLSGLTLGNEISYVMPQELVKIFDTETEPLFDIKYLERNLMRFDFEGIVNDDGENVKIKSSPSHERGPVILCIDTSSSMQGIPESYAKAIAMSIASKCVSAQRDCFLINFSVHIEKLLIRKNIENSLDLIQEFLRKSFNGGSDLDEALEECLKLMKNDPAFYRSDLLCVTDGKVKYSDSMAELIKRRKKDEKNNFYELVVSTDYTDAYFYSESSMDLMDPKHLFDIIFRLNRNGNILTEFRNGKIKIYN